MEHRVDVRTAHGPRSAQDIRDKARQDTETSRKAQRERLLSAKRVRIQTESIVEEIDVEYAFSEEDVARVRQAFQSGNAELVTKTLTELHVALANPSASTRHFVLEGDALQFLTNFLQSTQSEHQRQSLWCLSNIAAGSTEMCHKALSTAPYIIILLQNGDPAIQEQAAFVLGNIAADDTHCRSTLLANGVVKPLVDLLKPQNSGSVTVAACFAIANLLHGNRKDARLFVDAGVLPLLLHHFRSTQLDVASEVGWVLSYITAEDDQIVVQLMGQTLVSAVVEQLQAMLPPSVMALPLIRVVGNIICGPDIVAASFLEAPSFLTTLSTYLAADSRPIVKETLWVISNFTAGPINHIQAVESSGILQQVMNIFASGTFDMRKEAAYTVVNITRLGGEHLSFLVEHGLVKGVVELIRATDPETAILGLQILEIVLQLTPNGSQLVESVDGIDALDQFSLRNTPIEYSQRASQLVDKYFGENYGAENETTTVMEINPADLPPWRIHNDN